MTGRLPAVPQTASVPPENRQRDDSQTMSSLNGDAVPAASFPINGNLDHWKGIPPAFEGTGASGAIHIDKVYLAADQDYLYMRIDINDSSAPTFFHPYNFDVSSAASYGLDLTRGPVRVRLHVYLVPAHGISSQWYAEIDRQFGSRWNVVDTSRSHYALKGSSLEASFPIELIQQSLDVAGTEAAVSVTAFTGYIDSDFGEKGTEGDYNAWRKLKSPWKLLQGSGDRTEAKQYLLTSSLMQP